MYVIDSRFLDNRFLVKGFHARATRIARSAQPGRNTEALNNLVMFLHGATGLDRQVPLFNRFDQWYALYRVSV